jgi:hypothetical protein
MRQPWRIFNLAAALSDWNWWSASSKSTIALPNGAALPVALGQNTSEEGQADTVHGVVGVAIVQTGHNLPAVVFASPDNLPWYVPRLVVGTLPPDDVAVFNLTSSQPASAPLREWPLQPLSGYAKIQEPSKPPTALHRLSYGRGRSTERAFADTGHALDFTNKAFECLDLIGWEHAAALLPTVVGQIVAARGAEESTAWRQPVDLVALCDEAASQLPEVFAGHCS